MFYPVNQSSFTFLIKLLSGKEDSFLGSRRRGKTGLQQL